MVHEAPLGCADQRL